MLVKTFGSAVYGIDATTISVEVSWTPTGRMYFIVGLPDNAIRESFQRIESSIKSIGLHMPRTKIVVNLAPADIRKSGTAFDLPIAIGILAASGQLEHTEHLDKYVMMGELGLDGSVRAIKGALPIAMQTRKEGFGGLLLPKANAREAGILNSLKVYGVNHINEVLEFFISDQQSLLPTIVNAKEEFFLAQEEHEGDFSDVKGQENIKRALEIAAAGGAQCATNWSAWSRENDAGETISIYSSSTFAGRSFGDHARTERGGQDQGKWNIDIPKAIPKPPSFDLGYRAHRRRIYTATRRNFPGT